MRTTCFREAYNLHGTLPSKLSGIASDFFDHLPVLVWPFFIIRFSTFFFFTIRFCTTSVGEELFLLLVLCIFVDNNATVVWTQQQLCNVIGSDAESPVLRLDRWLWDQRLFVFHHN